jgi:molecular chaperone DnaJ
MAGVRDGQEVNVLEGHEYMEGFKGEVRVKVRVSGKKGWRREGDDLWVEKKVGFREAVKGRVGMVKMLDGEKVEMSTGGVIVEGVYKVKGKGMKKWRREGRGDLYVKVTVVMPEKLDRRQREGILKALGKKGSKNEKRRNSMPFIEDLGILTENKGKKNKLDLVFGEK